MKTLKDFIVEHVDLNESKTSTKVRFDFTGLEGADEVLKTLENQEGCEIEDTLLTVIVDKDNVDKLKAVQDLLQEFTSTIRSSSKRASDEQYAQKTVSFENKLNELNNAIDELVNPDKDDIKDEKKDIKDDDKKDDKEDDKKDKKKDDKEDE